MAFLSITHTSGFLISTKCERESGQVSLAEGTGLGHSVGGIIGVHPSEGILGILFSKRILFCFLLSYAATASAFSP